MIGFNKESSSTSEHRNSIDFGMECQPNPQMYVFEENVHIFHDTVYRSDGEWNEIRIEKGELQYWVGNRLIYISKKFDSSDVYHFQASIHDQFSSGQMEYICDPLPYCDTFVCENGKLV